MEIKGERGKKNRSVPFVSEQLRGLHRDWITEELKKDQIRDGRWTQSVAVGQYDYIKQVQTALEVRGGDCIATDDGWQLKGPLGLDVTKQG